MKQAVRHIRTIRKDALPNQLHLAKKISKKRRESILMQIRKNMQILPLF